MYRDPATQEVSRGDHPLQSFQTLDQTWAAHPDAKRVILMGNSQTQMTSLARGEAPPTGPEKTYTDLLHEDGKMFYRLSAGALSYHEMLWYAEYLASKPGIKPDVLIIQLNYQNFANVGVRGGMLEMLNDPAFRARIEDAAAFPEALASWRATPRQTTAQPATPGDRVETSVRAELSHMPGFDKRDASKQSFVYILVRCRSYLLHLDAASRRSLAGVRVASSRAALENLIALCRRSGIRVILFQAPTNPLVPLYGTPDDDRQYHEFCASLGVPVLDFEHAIPAAQWGMTLNVPDPLHLSRAGHRRLAELMLAALRENGL